MSNAPSPDPVPDASSAGESPDDDPDASGPADDEDDETGGPLRTALGALRARLSGRSPEAERPSD